jgi:hypothetical protein
MLTLKKINALMFEKSTLSINIDLIFTTFHFDLIGAATSCFASASGTTVRGVNTNKCECVNKMTTIRAMRMFIS